MRSWWRRLGRYALWIGDVLDPPCPARCGYYAHGRRTLYDHLETNPGCRAIYERRQEEAR